MFIVPISFLYRFIRLNTVVVLLGIFLIVSCNGNPSRNTEIRASGAVIEQWEQAPEIEVTVDYIPSKSKTALYLDSLGLVDVTDLDPGIAVELMYNKPTNFTGEILYTDLREAYLHPDAAYGLVDAQRFLKEVHPEYSLLIYDAARPMSAQQKMWDVVKGTSKQIYVSNPARGGGLHNYGLAVDVGIVDDHGSPLPMGTEVDHLGKEAHITHEEVMVKQGVITEQERQNRLLLRTVMRKAGFRALPSEWWHFNWCSRDEAKRSYQVIE